MHEEGSEVVIEHRIVPGPSDRSYGIHVARAGLPCARFFPAEPLLRDLEAARGAPRSLAPNGHVPAQPPLFGGPSPVEEALARLDVDGMTPIEAIQKLYELRAAVCARPGEPRR